jgi:hypothetical protein
MPDMDDQRWQEHMERYERALLAVILAGSITAGVLFGEEHELHIHTETGPIPTTTDIGLGSPIVTGAGRLY